MLLMERDGSITRPAALERTDPVLPTEPPERPGAVHRRSTHVVAQDDVAWPVTGMRDALVVLRPVRQGRMRLRFGSAWLPRSSAADVASVTLDA